MMILPLAIGKSVSIQVIAQDKDYAIDVNSWVILP